MAVVHSCQSYRIWQSWKSINHDPLLTANSTVGHSKRFFMYHSYPLKTTAASWINHHLKNASITTPSLMLKSLYIYIKGYIYILYNTYTPMTQCLPAKDPPPIRLFSQVSRIAVDQQVVKAAPGDRRRRPNPAPSHHKSPFFESYK